MKAAMQNTSARHSSRWAALGGLATAGVAALITVAAAQAPAAALLVVLRSEPGGPILAIVDPGTGKVSGRVPIGTDPHGVAVSEDGKLAFVANTNGHNQTIPEGDSLSVVDIAARKEVRRVEIGQGTRPHDVHVVGGKVYFSASGFKALGRYDPARNKVEYFGLGQNGPHMLTVSRDAKTIFAANNGSGTVSVIEGAGPPDWKVTSIAIGGVPEGTDMSPDGKQVWTVSEEGGTVTIFDVATKKVTETLKVQTDHANRLKFTPNGKQVIVLDREIGDVVVIDAATRQVAKRIKMAGDKPGVAMGLGDLALVPDSSRVYVTVDARAAGGRHYIAVIDLKTLAMTSRIETTTFGDGLAWAAPNTKSSD